MKGWQVPVVQRDRCSLGSPSGVYCDLGMLQSAVIYCSFVKVLMWDDLDPRGPYTYLHIDFYIICHVLPMLAMFCHVLPCFWTVLIPRPHACSAPRSRQTKAPLACRSREGSCACFLIYRLLATFGWPAHTHTQWFTMVCIYARIISTCYSMWLIP